MEKNHSDEIKKDERKLLSEIIKNAKENTETIAKHCGFSKQKITRMIKQLEQKKFIWGYTAVFDENKIGENHFVLLAKRSSKKINEETVDLIVSRNLGQCAAELGVFIESSFYVHGEYDWVLTCTAENILYAKKFSEELMKQLPGVFEKITIMQTLMFIRNQYILNPEKEKLKEFL
jgi:Lrp/AsnC family leucine-responsive transcriptional regulator